MGSLWPEITKNLGWEVNNGMKTKFWQNKWLCKEKPLSELCVKMPGEEELEKKVAEYVNGAEWKIDVLRNFLSQDILSNVTACLPPCLDDGDGDDNVKWMGMRSSCFNVTEMYEQLSGRSSDGEDPLWKAVWKWKGPKRIQTMLWFAAVDGLLTSERRSRVGLGFPACCRCRGEIENVVHVLRD